MRRKNCRPNAATSANRRTASWLSVISFETRSVTMKPSLEVKSTILATFSSCDLEI